MRHYILNKRGVYLVGMSGSFTNLTIKYMACLKGEQLSTLPMEAEYVLVNVLKSGNTFEFNLP